MDGRTPFRQRPRLLRLGKNLSKRKQGGQSSRLLASFRFGRAKGVFIFSIGNTKYADELANVVGMYYYVVTYTHWR